MVHYKFIFLILSTNKIDVKSHYYNSLELYNNLKIYNELYFNIFKNDIKFFFIEYNSDINEEILEVNNFIYIKGYEYPLIPNLLKKTIVSLNYLQSKYNYDYIVRTNLTSCWNLYKLLNLYNEIPKKMFFGGPVNFNDFISGTGIIISNDLISQLIQLNVNSYNYNEDVAISYYMKSYVNMTDTNKLLNYKNNQQILYKNDNNVNSPHNVNNNLKIDDNTHIDDILYFRIKTCSHEEDLSIFRKLLKKIYNISV